MNFAFLVNYFYKNLSKSFPAKSNLIIAWGNAYPSYIGTAWVTSAPISNTIPVILVFAYNAKTEVFDIYIASAPKSLNNFIATISLSSFGFNGGSVTWTIDPYGFWFNNLNEYSTI